MSDAIFPSKRSDAVITLKFAFEDQLEFGEIVTGAYVNCGVFTGVDPIPSTVLDGSASVSDGVNILQAVKDGEPGVIYQLIATATTSNANMYTKAGKLAIVNETQAFNGDT